MEGMFNPTSILLHILNALLLLVALYFLLVKPVRAFMNKRTAAIESQMSEVKLAEAAVEQDREAVRKELAYAKQATADAIQESVAQAHQQAEQVLHEAHQNAQLRIERTRIECEDMRRTAGQSMKSDVANLGVALAQKILKREVTLEDHQKLVEEFIERVG